MRIILASFSSADNLATTSVGIVAPHGRSISRGVESTEVLAADDTGAALAPWAVEDRHSPKVTSEASG